MTNSNIMAAEKHDAGYTLVELLVVLAVLGLATSLILPRVGTGKERVALRAAAMQIAAGLRATRTHAISGSAETAFVIDVDQRRYWADGAVKARLVSKGIAIVTGDKPGTPSAASRTAVRFRPDGSASGGWIGLRARSSQADITVDWLTGATRIEWVK